MFSDPLNVAIPDRSEDKIAQRKWLIDSGVASPTI